jgi:membrane-associated phospholipid phosphatase
MDKSDSVFVVPEREMILLFWKWAGVVLSVLSATYLVANRLAAENPKRYEMYIEWELGIPLVPSMIVVYLSYAAVFFLLPLVLKKTQALVSLAYSFLFGILVSTSIFILFPGELGYSRPEFVEGYDFLYQTLHQIDRPHNLFPSLHVTFSSLTAFAMVHQTTTRWFHVAILLWAFVIATSVILVNQHHLFDIITGLGLAVCCYRFIYLRNV